MIFSRTKKTILFIIAALSLSAVVFLLSLHGKNVAISNRSAEQSAQVTIEGAAQPKATKALFVSAWIPYWAKAAGVQSLSGNLGIFNELHPFSFGVDASGNLTDTMEIKQSPWTGLLAQARQKNIPIVPTVMWGDASAMHTVFSNQNLEQKHIDSILSMVTENNFPGVDIDYEGKDVADKDNFSNFISDLSEKMHALGKTLNCSVEAKTQDQPTQGLTGTRAMSWANDFSSLGKNCDSVTIMAYDQALQIHRANSFDDLSAELSAPNAANDWVESNVQYALKYIPAQKIILGIPTYGWEFSWEKIAGGYHYERIKSISYPDAMAEAEAAGAQVQRSAQGELYFTYKSAGENRIVTFEDAESVKEKIAIAQKYGLKGISIFKIDGLSDPNLFSILENNKGE